MFLMKLGRVLTIFMELTYAVIIDRAGESFSSMKSTSIAI